MASEFRQEPVLRLLLNRENPRHSPKENQAEIIEHLVEDEEVYNLARHLSKHGFNPLEVTAVFPDDDGNLVVAEGNRRICAAQLINDPEKAPAATRAKFKALAKSARANVAKVMVREFPGYDAARPWLQVLHDGEQEGVGRRQWSPTQKSRATLRKSTDALAVALLDHAEATGWLAPDARQGILLSTVTRYLANPEVRAALGLASTATSSEIEAYGDRTRFETATRRFLGDAKTGALSSRSKGDDWRNYARKLENEYGKLGTSEPHWRPTESGAKPATGKAKPASHRAKVRLAPPDTSKILPSNALVEALNALGSHKLSSLYNSLTTLRLDEHPALLTVGAWVFLETLTARHGRADGVQFTAYLNGKFSASSLGRTAWKSKRAALEFIENHGNITKHDPSFSLIDARNLYNHFLTLDDLLVKLVSECPR